MNKKFIKQPLKGITVTESAVGTRTPNILMGEHAGEYVRGDIMDANAVIQAFDELKGGVDEGHDTLKELNEEIKTNATVINGAITKLNKETEDRINEDARIAATVNMINGDAKTDGSFRKAIADVVGTAPEDLDTLKEIADKLTSNDDIHTALNAAIAEKASKEELGQYMKTSLNSGDDIAKNAPLIKGGKINNAIIDSFVRSDIIKTEYDYGTLKLSPYDLVINNGKNDSYRFNSTSDIAARAFYIDSYLKLGNKSVTNKLSLGCLSEDIGSTSEGNFGLKSIRNIVDGNSKRTDAVLFMSTFNELGYTEVDPNSGAQFIVYSRNYPNGATSKKGEIESCAISETYEDIARISVLSYITDAYKRTKLNEVDILSDYNNLLSKIEFKKGSSVDIAIENSDSRKGVYINGFTSKDILNANYGSVHIGASDDTAEYTSVAPIINGLIPSRYIDFSLYAEKSSIPTKVSQLTNDAKYLTSYTETDPVWTSEKANYYTKAEVDGKGYLTEHQSLADYAKKTELESKANSTEVAALQAKITELENRIAALEAANTTE